jgi:hypothetical protein
VLSDVTTHLTHLLDSRLAAYKEAAGANFGDEGLSLFDQFQEQINRLYNLQESTGSRRGACSEYSDLLSSEMHRYVERCLPTLERFRGLVRARAEVEAAQREVPRVWGRVSKTVVKWVEEIKQTVEEAIQGPGEIQYPKSQ